MVSRALLYESRIGSKAWGVSYQAGFASRRREGETACWRTRSTQSAHAELPESRPLCCVMPGLIDALDLPVGQSGNP